MINLAWCLLFRNHVYIHHYAQWFFLPAAILLLGAALNDLNTRMPRGRWISLTALGVVIIATSWQSVNQWLELKPNAKQIADMQTIQSVPAILLVSSPQVSGPRDYWSNPAVQLYTDPVYRNSRAVGVRFERPEGMVPHLIPVLRTNEAKVRASEIRNALEVVEESPHFLFVRLVLPVSGDPLPEDGNETQFD